MKTAALLATALALAIVPPLTSVGCNKSENDAPVPAVTQVTVAPPPVTPTPAAPPTALAPPAAMPTPARPAAVRIDGGVRARDAAVVAVTFDASTLPFPFPPLHPSTLPAIASGIASIAAALPSGLIPPAPPPAASK